jgi:hypothetical protein
MVLLYRPDILRTERNGWSDQSCKSISFTPSIATNEYQANGTTVAKQIAAAKSQSLELGPGQGWPIEGQQAGSNTAKNGSSATTSPTPSPSGVHDHKLSGGAIAGIAVGSAAVVILAAALCYFVGRSNTYREVIKENQTRASDGIPSEIGGGAGVGSPAAQTPHPYQDHRISGQTAYTGISHISPQVDTGTFVGYNRNTGAPEFVAEAPSGGEPKYSGHPAFGESQQHTTYELPGENAEVSEMPLGIGHQQPKLQ